MHDPHSAYTQQDVTNETPLGLIARVYQVARLDVRRARKAVTEGDFRTKGHAISRLLRALTLLQNSLDMKQGGEVAANLDRIYTYLIQRVSESNVQDDAEPLVEVERHLKELGEAWAEVARRATAIPPRFETSAPAEATAAR